jgi:hypothetical protein
MQEWARNAFLSFFLARIPATLAILASRDDHGHARQAQPPCACAEALLPSVAIQPLILPNTFRAQPPSLPIKH